MGRESQWDLTLYGVILNNLGVSPGDTLRAIQSLAARIERLPRLKRQSRSEEESRINFFFRILAEEVLNRSIERVEALYQIGINPFDEQLVEFCESQGNLGIVYYLVACYTAEALSELLREGRMIVTSADLVHPNQNVRGNNPPFSLWGAFKISEQLGFSSSAPSNLGRAMSDAIQQCCQAGDIKPGGILDESILANASAINLNGGWRWFVPNVLLPLREEVCKKYF